MAQSKSLVYTDQATDDDRLSFEPYRDTLIEVIRFTETPLTVGIFGSWGSGKTSLLLMLQDSLKKAEGEPHARTVLFNAWQYGQEAALWRALLSRVLETLQPPEPPEGESLDDDELELKSQINDLQASLYRDVDREEIGGFEIDWEQLTKGGLKGAVKFGLSYIPGAKLLDDLVAAADKESETWAEEVLSAFRREKTRIHLDQVRFLEQFRQNFEELVKKYIVEKGERLVVFVDDLDRCLPEKAIEVLEAIKLFLDVDGCLFVVAVDRDVIVEGIRVRYREFALYENGETKLPIKGADYLEKIIQLPFFLPPVSRDTMMSYISDMAADLPEGCADVFSIGVETNPRKIKRVLNVFWMHSQLAELQEELKDVIKSVRLAKVVVIQNRYLKLYHDWVEAPLLLRHLEERFLAEKQWEEESEESSASVDPTKAEEKGPDLSPSLDSDLVRKWVDHRLQPLGKCCSTGLGRMIWVLQGWNRMSWRNTFT